MNHFPNQFIAVSGKNKLKALNLPHAPQKQYGLELY